MMDSSEMPAPKVTKKPYIELWSQKLHTLDDTNFWEYLKLYGIVQKNNNGCRLQALNKLIRAPFVDEKFAVRELMYLKNIE